MSDIPLEAQTWFEAAQQLAEQAGKIVAKRIIELGRKVDQKSSYADLVTDTDREVEELFISEIKRQFPDHQFIGEESTADGAPCNLTDAPTWIVDPVDGTMNFVHGFPVVSVSVGLAFKKKVILGVVYCPMLDEMYTAMKDCGAFRNGKKLSVSGETDIGKALIACEVGSNRDPKILEQVSANYRNLAAKVHGIRSMGSAAYNMCCVANGALDSYFEYSLHCWDMAAGKIIIEEAGGFVLDPEGGFLDLMSRRVLCASSPELAKAMSQNLQHIQLPRD